MNNPEFVALRSPAWWSLYRYVRRVTPEFIESWNEPTFFPRNEAAAILRRLRSWGENYRVVKP